MKRLLRSGRTPEAPKPDTRKEPLPQRWVIILVISALGGTATGAAAGSLSLGVATGLSTIGLLHAVME